LFISENGKWEMIEFLAVYLDFNTDMTFDKWFDMIINIIKTIQMEYEKTHISKRTRDSLST
jgi:hypothetical protein